MTVYTVTSTDAIVCEPLGRCVIGSYTTRGRALDECTRYIMERLEIRNHLAWSMAHDENHPEAKEFFSERRKDGLVTVRKDCMKKLKELLRNELDGQGCYFIYDGASNWHFDIDENGVEGELWHTVTWGDSDCEDPEFTTPWPETFTSEEAAIEAFVDYVKDLYGSNRMEWPDELVRKTRDSLRKDGRVQVDLKDGCCVSCVLYHDDARNIKE